MKNIFLLLILTLISCTEDQWKIEPANKFLEANTIDTAKYKTYDELFINGEIKKIITRADSIDNYNYFHFRLPKVYNEQYLFLEKKIPHNEDKDIILKIDKNGETLDSLLINRYFAIINDYIIDKDSYITWFLDSDKTPKTLKNINYFSKSDTTEIKDLVNNMIKENVPYYISSQSSNEEKIDTCNYIISFKNKKLVKYNFLKSIDAKYDLKLKNENSPEISTKSRSIKAVKSETIFKVDNFYANTFERFKKGNKINFNLYLNGGGFPQCDRFRGTTYITFANNLKLKFLNNTICEKGEINEFAEFREVYSEDFLDFYLINIRTANFASPTFYIVKK